MKVSSIDLLLKQWLKISSTLFHSGFKLQGTFCCCWVFFFYTPLSTPEDNICNKVTFRTFLTMYLPFCDLFNTIVVQIRTGSTYIHLYAIEKVTINLAATHHTHLLSHGVLSCIFGLERHKAETEALLPPWHFSAGVGKESCLSDGKSGTEVPLPC